MTYELLCSVETVIEQHRRQEELYTSVAVCTLWAYNNFLIMHNSLLEPFNYVTSSTSIM